MNTTWNGRTSSSRVILWIKRDRVFDGCPEYTKLDIAVEHLDAAMQMYLAQRYFSAIHLAAAALELFDFHLPEEKRLFGLAVNAERGLHKYETGELLDDKAIKEKLNLLKNSVKHMNDGERTIDIDPSEEAEWQIELALLSSYRLGLRKTQTTFKYNDFRSSKCEPRRKRSPQNESRAENRSGDWDRMRTAEQHIPERNHVQARARRYDRAS
jgi:hypothetical protein